MLPAALAGVLSLAVAGTAAVPATVEVALVARGGVEEGAAVEVVVTADASGKSETVELRTGNPVVAIQLPGSGPWRLRCQAEQTWCPTLEIEDPPTGPLVVPAYRKTTLRGVLLPPGRRRPPETVAVQGWVDVKRHGSLSASETVFVERVAVEDGRFQVEVPAAQLDLRIAVPGAAPIYRWKVSTESEALDLGRIELHPGASVSGFVTSVNGAPLSDAEIEIAPLAAAGTAETEAALERIAQRTKTDRAGFFQIGELSPGRYRLRASARDGLAATVEPVELTEDEEVHLRSVRLAPPLVLRVLLSPAQPPGGDESWNIRVDSLSGSEVHRQGSASGGEATFSPLPPGRYRVLVLSGTRDVVAERTVELEADQDLPIEIDIVAVEGRVRLGGEPLVAKIELHTGNSDQHAFESDGEGRFGGWLRSPAWDWLLVEISSPLLPGKRRLELVGSEVEIEDGILHLDLDLPDGRIEGGLVDHLGRPVTGVEVAAWRERDPDARTFTREGGRFSLGGLEHGRYWVTAGHSKLGAIQPVEVELTEADDEVELWLVLLPLEEIAGTLTTAEGQPVPAAEVAIDSHGTSFSTSATTDPAGSFRASVLAGTSQVSVVVLAPSHGLWAGCLPLADDRSLPIRLPSGAPGELRLVVEWDEDLPPAPGDLGLVSESGGRIGAGVLNYWRHKVGAGGAEAGVQVVPALLPGAWAISWSREPAWLAVQTACLRPPSGTDRLSIVPPHGVAELRYDVEPHQRERLEEARRTSGRD